MQTLKLSPYLLSSVSNNPASLLSGSANVGTGVFQRPGVAGLGNSQGQGLLGNVGNTVGGGPFFPLKGGPVLGSLLQLAGTAHLLRAASWELYGRLYFSFIFLVFQSFMISSAISVIIVSIFLF